MISKRRLAGIVVVGMGFSGSVFATGVLPLGVGRWACREARSAVVNPVVRSPLQPFVSLRGEWEFVTNGVALSSDPGGQALCEQPWPERFHSDMKALVEALCVSFPEAIVMIHYPTGYTKAPGADPENLARYKGEIDSLVAEIGRSYPGRVFLGDVKAWKFFDENHETHWFKEMRGSTQYYVHPNEQGAQAIGQLWGEALARALDRVSREVGVKNRRDIE